MTWTRNLLPALGAAWYVKEGTPIFEGGFVTRDTSNVQLAVTVADLNKSYDELKLIVRYRRTDDSIVAPHDNPCLPKIITTLNVFPVVPTDTEDEDAEPLYFQHIMVPASQSYTTSTLYTRSGIPEPYCYTCVKVPIDVKLSGVAKIACNLYLYAPCIVYSITLQGRYTDTEAVEVIQGTV